MEQGKRRNCRGCPDRHIGCHGRDPETGEYLCPVYAEFRKHYDAMQNNRDKTLEARQFLIDSTTKSIRKMGKKYKK